MQTNQLTSAFGHNLLLIWCGTDREEMSTDYAAMTMSPLLSPDSLTYL